MSELLLQNFVNERVKRLDQLLDVKKVEVFVTAAGFKPYDWIIAGTKDYDSKTRFRCEDAMNKFFMELPSWLLERKALFNSICFDLLPKAQAAINEVEGLRQSVDALKEQLLERKGEILELRIRIREKKAKVVPEPVKVEEPEKKEDGKEAQEEFI